MAVKVKKSNIHDVTATGTLIHVGEDCIKVEDEKTGVQSFNFDVFKHFVGKEITLKLSHKEEI